MQQPMQPQQANDGFGALENLAQEQQPYGGYGYGYPQQQQQPQQAQQSYGYGYPQQSPAMQPSYPQQSPAMQPAYQQAPAQPAADSFVW